MSPCMHPDQAEKGAAEHTACTSLNVRRCDKETRYDSRVRSVAEHTRPAVRGRAHTLELRLRCG